ncbi:MAG: ABC-2 transporter permease [Oscillospiraceae bacterium]|nr:ABC-2 transporter permease [Oscillospiraceae bacterium]
MFDLLCKELRLAVHPSLFVFIFLGALVLVPAYPYGMVFFFAMLGIFQSIMYARETRDIYFTALLPVRKRDAVKSKLLLASFAQLTQLLLSLPFAFLRTLYMPEGNPAGIEANATYYGFGLMIFGVFNLVFFTRFFKTAYKAGAAFLTALLPAMAGIFAMEAAVHFPGMEWLDSTSPDQLIRQLPILLAGIIIYAGTWLLTYKAASKQFEKVDL